MQERSLARAGRRGPGLVAALSSTAGRLSVCALAGVLLFALWTASASAVLVRFSNGRALSYQPVQNPLGGAPLNKAAKGLSKPGAALEYNGGPVMTSNANYAFYWAPAGAGAYPAGYQAGIDGYFEGLAKDSGTSQNVDSVATQYTNSSGEPAAYVSKFAGAIIDTNPYPPNGCSAAPTCLTKEQLESELYKYVTAHGLPADLWHEYFILTPPAVESCFESAGLSCSAGSSSPAFCAFHSYISAGAGVIVYADDPYATGVYGCDTGEHPSESVAEGTLQGGLSHEHNESITDPELNAWYGPEGNENGDKCRTFEPTSEFGTQLGLAPDGAPYNQVVGGVDYWYQQEWSNRTLNCQQRLASEPPAVSKIKARTGPAVGGTTVTITGTRFTGASAVSFGSVPAKSFAIVSDSSITATSPAGTTGVADVRVTAHGGTSAIASGDRFTYGAPTVTSVSPSGGSAAGGTPVTITGSGFAVGTSTLFRFGSVVAASVVCSSSASCTTTAPKAAKPATVDVRATVAGKKSRKSRPGDSFTYS